MNEDYLWDKSGEPDPEIQQLEEILKPLRYEPQSLVIPANLAIQRRRRYFPALAIAATVLLALVAAGVWFRLHAGNKSQPEQANVTKPQPALEEKHKTPAPAANLVQQKTQGTTPANPIKNQHRVG